jgi:hypothetical protein
MISFGKHKGKTYDYIIENDKSYCSFVLNQTNCSKGFKHFQDYLKLNCEKLYDINKLKNIGCINCTQLTKYMFNDIDVNNIIKNIEINNISIDKINININIKPELYGQFIDYLIRYEISKINNIKFIDDRTEKFINHNLPCIYSNFGNLIHEELSISVWDIDNNLDNFLYDNIDDDFLDKLKNSSNISEQDINKIKDAFYKYRINLYQIMKNSYYKMQNNNNVSFIDILNVSIFHSLSFCRNDDIKYVNYEEDIINKKSYDNIIKYIQNKVFNKRNILINPQFGNIYLGINGDGDLIIDDELIDIKISKSVGLNINDFIQLIVYATLYYLKTNIICNKLTIYNPLLGKEYNIIISLDIINKFIIILENYDICPYYKNFTFNIPKPSDINNIKCYNSILAYKSINIKNNNLIHIINFIINNDNLNKYKKNKKNGLKWIKIENDFNKIINNLLIEIEKTYSINCEYEYNIIWNKYTHSMQLKICHNSFNFICKDLFFTYDNDELKLNKYLMEHKLI